MLDTRQAAHSHQNWSLDDIAWDEIDRASIAGQEDLFFFVATASFVESMADVYTDHLVDYFAGDETIRDWLDRHWQPEELQHGAALRRYVNVVWPEFDWEAAYSSFLVEYGAYCKPESLERDRGLEMAARCVVEMGTASYYTTLSRVSPDPILADLAHRIAADEVRHYKHFYQYFRHYREAESLSRFHVAEALWRRLRQLDGHDGYIATKHVHLGRHPDRPFDDGVYRAVRGRAKSLIREHFPYVMSVRMLLKPLDLGRWSQSLAVPVVEKLARRLVP